MAKRARHDGLRRAPHRGHRGFSYVEITITLALMTIIMGLFAFVLDSGSDNFFLSCTKGSLSLGCLGALGAMEADFRETATDTITTHTFEEDGFSEAQCAVVLASARDSSGGFRKTDDYRPDWQAVVVYCPYVTSKGVRQLRRYVYFDDGYEFPFQFDGPDPITADEIRLRDAGSSPQTLTIDRTNGNAAADPTFRVFCPGLTKLDVEKGAPCKLSITAQSVARKGVRLEVSDVRYVGQRN